MATKRRMDAAYRLALQALDGEEPTARDADGFNGFYLQSCDLPRRCYGDLGTVYIACLDQMIKVGFTIAPKQRINDLEHQNGARFDVIYLSPQCRNYREVEVRAHTLFKKYQQLGEWFRANFAAAVALMQGIEIDAPPPIPMEEYCREYANRVICP